MFDDQRGSASAPPIQGSLAAAESCTQTRLSLTQGPNPWLTLHSAASSTTLLYIIIPESTVAQQFLSLEVV